MAQIIGIYKLENFSTDEWYVGKSKNIYGRWIKHSRKYKPAEGWTSRILEECEHESLNEREKFHIANEKLNGGVCKNKTTGGSRSTEFSDETKALLRVKQKEANSRPEVIEKKQIAQKIAQNRPEVKEKRLKTMNSPETKARCSIAAKESAARPEEKERKSVALRAAFSRPEVKAKMRDSAIVANARPGARERKIAAAKEAMNRPEVKEKARATHIRKQEEKRLVIEKETIEIILNETINLL